MNEKHLQLRNVFKMKRIEKLIGTIGFIILVWAIASLSISFSRGLSHINRVDNYCQPNWGIQNFVLGNLFCNDEKIFHPKD